MSANLLERVTPDWRLTDDPVRRVLRGRRADGKETTILIVESWTPEPDAQLVALAYDHALLLRALTAGEVEWSMATREIRFVCSYPRRFIINFDAAGCPALTPELREALKRAIGIEAANG